MKPEAATSQDADLAIEAPAPCVREARLDVPDCAVEVLADRAHRPDDGATHGGVTPPSSDDAAMRPTERNSELRSRIGRVMQAAEFLNRL